MMYAQRSAETEKEMKRRKREVGQAQKRIAELDSIFKRIYEDDISGVISHERFLKVISGCYRGEQTYLARYFMEQCRRNITTRRKQNDHDGACM